MGSLSTNGTASHSRRDESSTILLQEFENWTKQNKKKTFLFDYKVPEENWKLISNVTVFEKVVLCYTM